MNTLRAVLFGAALLAQPVFAASLAHEATLHAAPDPSAPVVDTLPAGAAVESVRREELAAAGIAEPPAGWLAVRHDIVLEGYVRNRDIGKDFAMKPDSPFFADAAEDAPVQQMVGPVDRVETGDPVGRFSKAVLRRNQIVFLQSVPPASRAMARDLPAPAPTPSQSPATPEPPITTAAPPPASSEAPASTEIASAPRSFQGYLMRTRRILGRGPKLDYQLVDEDNRRIALLDVSALLVTEPIEFFEGRLVTIYGPGARMEGVTDAIIRVENLRLAR